MKGISNEVKRRTDDFRNDVIEAGKVTIKKGIHIRKEVSKQVEILIQPVIESTGIDPFEIQDSVNEALAQGVLAGLLVRSRLNNMNHLKAIADDPGGIGPGLGAWSLQFTKGLGNAMLEIAFQPYKLNKGLLGDIYGEEWEEDIDNMIEAYDYMQDVWSYTVDEKSNPLAVNFPLL